jgi:hypothetical protein
MPDSSGPGWALGAGRPPAGRMTRAGRLRASPAPGAFAGRTAAGGLCSGTVALGGQGCPTTKGPGRAVDAARPGRDPHARVFEGGRFAFRAGGSSRPRRISGQLGLDSGRELAPGHRQAFFAGRMPESSRACGSLGGRWSTSGWALAAWRPGRAQAPRRPHDAGRPTGAVAGTRGRRRPNRGGRPELGDGGPSSGRGSAARAWRGPGLRLGVPASAAFRIKGKDRRSHLPRESGPLMAFL